MPPSHGSTHLQGGKGRPTRRTSCARQSQPALLPDSPSRRASWPLPRRSRRPPPISTCSTASPTPRWMSMSTVQSTLRRLPARHVRRPARPARGRLRGRPDRAGRARRTARRCSARSPSPSRRTRATRRPPTSTRTATGTAKLFTNDVATTNAGEGRLTVRHTAAAPAVDILANGAVAFSNVVNGAEGTTALPVGTIVGIRRRRGNHRARRARPGRRGDQGRRPDDRLRVGQPGGRHPRPGRSGDHRRSHRPPVASRRAPPATPPSATR